MDLQHRFTEFINKEGLFGLKDRLLLAVSGGVDSVVLCELCRQAGFTFSIAHCNFQLRGEESERDEHFVGELAKKYDVPFLLKKFDTAKYAEDNKVSIQVAARELRYNWFNEIPNVDYILTAHHADDTIETVMMNFFKGTGISGLRGILPKQHKIVRPLLFAYKEELLAFAKENNLPFVEDSSNTSDKYTRNYFRNQVLPSIEKVFPAVKENLLDNINRFRDVEALYKQSIQLYKKKLLEYKDNEIYIPILKLLKLTPVETILYEIIKEYGFSSHQVAEVLNIATSGSGKWVASATHRIIKNRNWFVISPIKTEAAHFIVIEKGDKKVDFPAGKLTINEYPAGRPINTDLHSAQLDADKIEFPLILRKWKQGDYFYPLGMNKKKKLSRFFIDQKLSLVEKENSWVLEMNKKIIWIVGRRIDDRFKITDKTKQVLLLKKHFP